MPTIIKGNLIMEKDIEYNGDLIVEGNILGKNGKRYNLKVNGNIKAGDIAAWNIITRNINADNISARDIKAWNIIAGNITYYAVCFAYYDIKCKSIKGRKRNSKHFVLYGKIEAME
jgi:hypothetical protein